MAGAETISFCIPGDAVPFARAGANGRRRFTPRRQADFQATVKLFGSRAFAGREPLAGPVSMTMRVTYAVPASWPKWKKAIAVWKPSKPDGDNLFKIVADALNGIAWVDDAQIVDLSVQKKYGAVPGTVVSICELAPCHQQ